MENMIAGVVLGGIIVGVVSSDYWNWSFGVDGKKEECEQTLVLRNDSCNPYYLTNNEVKSIKRLEEFANEL